MFEDMAEPIISGREDLLPQIRSYRGFALVRAIRSRAASVIRPFPEMGKQRHGFMAGVMSRFQDRYNRPSLSFSRPLPLFNPEVLRRKSCCLETCLRGGSDGSAVN